MATNSLTTPNFLSGGGEMGDRILSKDWSKTPLGSPDKWSAHLKIALNIAMNAGYPMFLVWGEDMIKFYNDAYSPILGNKHPWALGRNFKEIWAEIWNDIGPIAADVYRGGSFYTEEMLLFMERKGFLEETYYTFSYSPILQEEGSVGGLFCACIEDTAKVLRRRRLNTLKNISELSAESMSIEQICYHSVELLTKNHRDIPFAAIYLFSEEDKTLRLCSQNGFTEPESELLPGRFATTDSFASRFWEIEQVVRRSEPVLVENLSKKYPAILRLCPDCTERAMALPLKKTEQERLSGILICGASQHLEMNDEYHAFLQLAARQVAAAIATVTAYEEERRRRQMLEELDRSKTVFFNNISHEFRTPLTLMLSPLEELEQAAATRSASAVELENYSMVRRNTQRLLKLVNNLLDFSRLETGRIQAVFEPVDLAASVSDLASAFRSMVEKAGMTLDVDCPPLGEPVFMDRSMLEKIVLNLLSNAFKFTLEGGISVRLRKGAHVAVLQISDTGTGIPEADLPHVFDRFYRVQNAGGRTFEGSGIGLSLVKELVKLHAGDIGIESKLNEGTTVTIHLRLGKAHLPTGLVNQPGNTVAHYHRILPEDIESWNIELPLARPSGKPKEKQPGSNLPRILVADDNADMLRFLTHLLEKDYDVEAVANGKQALEAARRCLPDLVLADIMMPELDGIALLRHLRSDHRTRDVPVIFLSARAGEEEIVKGMETGADDYLVKPFSSRELLSRINANLKIAASRKTAERNLHNVLMQAPVAICIYRGADFVIELANKRCLQLWSMTAEQVIGKPLVEVYPSAKEPGGLDNYNHVLYTGKPLSFFETPIKWQREGKEVTGWYNFQLEPLRDLDGSVSGIIGLGTEVTEQVETRKQAEESTKRLEIAIETAEMGTWEYDPIADHITCSPRTVDFFGFAPGEELTLARAIAAMHQDDQQRVLAAVHWALQPASGGIYDIEYTVVNLHDRIHRRVRAKGQCYFNEAGVAHRFIGTIMDVTEQRKVRELLEGEIEKRTQALQQAYRLLQQTNQTFEHAERIGKFGSYAYSYDTGKLTYSDNLYHLLGCQPGEFEPGAGFYKFVHPDEAADVRRWQAEAFKDKQLSKWIYRMVRKDEQTIWVRGSGELVTDEQGNNWLIGTLQDITEEKDKEQQLRQQKEFVETLIDNSVDLILFFDRNHRIQLLNKKVEELYGFRREQVLGKTITELYPTAKAIYPDMEKAMKGEPVYLPDYRSQVSGRIYEVFHIPLLNDGQVYGVLSIAHDNTSLLETKQKLQDIEEKNRELEQFAYLASHDLREPLNTINSFAVLLEEEQPMEPHAAQYLGFIKDSASRLADLINDLLEHSKIGRQGEAKPVDFKEMVNDVLTDMQARIAEKTARIHLSELPVLKAYPAEIRLLFQNLISNAIKFQQPDAVPEVKIWADKTLEGWHFVVEDNGIGIEQRFRERVFVIFQRLNSANDYEGTGIGLAHCKKIIDLHGGRIWIESEVGKGSRFHFTIPERETV